MYNSDSWGRIVYDEPKDEDSDPVLKLLKQIDEIREKLEHESGESLEEYEDRKAHLINDLEHKISDIIYHRKIVKMGK